MHKFKWGGVCPDSLYFEHGRYKSGKCTFWQYRFYKSWGHHGERGQVDPLFFDFSVAYDWLIHDYELFDQYVEICNKIEQGLIPLRSWCWEKDGSGTHLFGPGLQWTTFSVNMIQRNIDNSYWEISRLKAYSPESCKKRAISQGHPVIAISPEGIVTEYYGISEASRKLGFSAQTIKDLCDCRSGSHTAKQGKAYKWQFYYKEG